VRPVSAARDVWPSHRDLCERTLGKAEEYAGAVRAADCIGVERCGGWSVSSSESFPMIMILGGLGGGRWHAGAGTEAVGPQPKL